MHASFMYLISKSPAYCFYGNYALFIILPVSTNIITSGRKPLELLYIDNRQTNTDNR